MQKQEAFSDRDGRRVVVVVLVERMRDGALGGWGVTCHTARRALCAPTVGALRGKKGGDWCATACVGRGADRWIALGEMGRNGWDILNIFADILNLFGVIGESI